MPDEPVALEIVYDLSFVDFDVCGDVEAGRILRRLLIAKVESCPYSDSAREKFRTHIAKTDYDMRSVEGQLDQWQSYLEVEKGMSCKEYRKTPAYLEKRLRLLRYQHGEIGVDEALDLSDCPSGPASL